jgi:PAS domain S-box-containing protein
MDLDLSTVAGPADLSFHAAAFIQHSPGAMAILEGEDHVLRYLNPAFSRLLQRSEIEVVGRPFREIMPENGECLDLLDRVLRTGKPETHTQEERSMSPLIFWSYEMWPVMMGQAATGVTLHVTETARFHETARAMNEALLIGCVREHELVDAAEDLNAKLRAEIQERAWAEDALRASEERFRVLFNLGPVAIFSCDRKGVIQNYNQRAAELWGQTPTFGETGEHFAALLKFYDAEGVILPYTASPILEVLRGNVFVRDKNVFIERPDGSRVAAAVTFVPLKDKQGTITGAITAFYDVTERQLLEDSLVARADDLLRADRSKDEFLAMLAHELRGPLAPLRNVAEILGLEDATPEMRDQAQSILVRQTGNMSRMIDDLLDVARISQGKIDLRKNIVPLEGIIAAAASLARSGMEARGQQLTIALPAEPVFLEADAARLDQVFGNLLTNACKFSDVGGRIWVTATRAGDAPDQSAVIVRVRDEGIGIAPDLLPRIFDLFVQASGALDRSRGGLGIGLTLVQRLVKMHGGDVEVRSDGLAHGSEFIVRLPILPAGACTETPPIEHSTRDVPRRILVVDDNEDSARSMSTIQRLRGHETRIAFTGPDAVEVAAEFSPEVVLLDIGLPGMDGFEVARRLRAMPETRRAFLVAVTGYGDPEDRAHARSVGFDEYLLKPVDLDLLRTWLHGRVQAGEPA